jgi:hypothetical protein
MDPSTIYTSLPTLSELPLLCEPISKYLEKEMNDPVSDLCLSLSLHLDSLL